jgi:hypothetical protein
MKSFRLGKEWRGKKIFGETLGQALLQTGLQFPDEFEHHQKIRSGQKIDVIKIINDELPVDNNFIRSIVELSTGRIVEVIAEILEVLPCQK